jgi:hypothetical protein
MVAGPATGFDKDDPLLKLMRPNIFCDVPDVEGLTAEQRFALHEFFHEVLAAGYRLYQVVPPSKAAPILKKRFGMTVPAPGP